MNTKPLEKFAQAARRQLKEQVAAKLARVLQTDSAELRGRGTAVQELKQQLAEHQREVVIERVAYTWFNRFCALRYMDVNGFTRIGVVSPAAGFTQPELLQEAKQGHIDDELTVDRQRVLDLLSGHLPSPDPQQEAYRLLLVATCNSYYATMPFLFERIADYTELLMPDDLLSVNSLLAGVRETMTPVACQDVEVIGWLYQFYISEKKDEVFAALKQNKKIAAADIPAATQLFTPHWIVRYLVENSLGRLWLLNRPHSRLAEQMPYYIKPEQPERDFLRVTSPEELTVCDPAGGSGHMLTYAFDLLYAIYEEEGYNPPDIPRLILEKNLYGIELDERAGALAAFALTMKAQAKDRRFFRRKSASGEPIAPNICVLQKLTFADGELEQDPWLASSGMLRKTLLHDLHLFAQTDYAGSLLRPQLSIGEIAILRERLAQSRPLMSDLFGGQRQEKVLAALVQAEYLARKYPVVVTNPPYMGGGGMNDDLNLFAKQEYPDSKADAYSMFIERSLDLAKPQGLIALVTMQSWMFLSSFEKLRQNLLTNQNIATLIQIGYNSFPELNSKVAQACAFVLKNYPDDVNGGYLNLNDAPQSADKEQIFLTKKQKSSIYWICKQDFKEIPGSPIAYWVSSALRKSFTNNPSFSSFFFSDGLTKTGNNDKYLRFHWEVSRRLAEDENRYRICVKGGETRSYYGNVDILINWSESARKFYRTDHVARITPEYLWNCPGISWTKISSKGPTFRWFGNGMIAETGGPAIFCKEEVQDEVLWQALGFLASKVSTEFLNVLNPTLASQTSDILSLPINISLDASTISKTISAYKLARLDWNSYETSVEFTVLPLLQLTFHHSSLDRTYSNFRTYWQDTILQMQRLEEENNRIFIEAYGLQDELTPDVPLSEITLTCNPYYRYDAKKSAAELEQLLLADTMRELISYGVGCMFGRYALDKPGLILANQGETLEEYIAKVTGENSTRNTQHASRITFLPDKDNVIPILDGDWFTDDISERFKHFLRVTFGEAHYAENLAFLEAAIGRDLRGYFLREFYDDHVRRYQKRPIYWLFASPKGSFNALIYMHRYRPDTVSVVLNDYLREFVTKLTARKAHLQTISISSAATARDKTVALKEIDKLDKTLAELTDYENEILYPLAMRQVQIDLDDGVKVNYNKFGKALRKITGMTD